MRIALATLCVLLAGPALADDSGANGTPGTHVEMPFLMAPMAEADGELTGYAFISTKVVATSPMAALDIRGHIAYIQDAFVRDVNAQSVSQKSDPAVVDTKALIGRLLEDAQNVMGPDKVVGVELIEVRIAPFRTDKAPIPPS